MNSFWAGFIGGISVPAILAVIGLMFKEHILLRLSESFKKKNQLEIEAVKGEILKTIEANKAQHLKDIESVKLTLNKDLEQFKQDYDRSKVTEDRKHQIAQEAYREFFTTKMEAYIELAKLKNNYTIAFSRYTHYPDFNDNPFDYLPKDEVDAIVKHVQNNSVYLDKALIEKFDAWHSPVEYEIYEETMKFDTDFYSYLPESEQQEKYLSYKQNIYEKYQGRFADFLDEVETNIRQLRLKYDL